ncbi:hypothetical protein GCM10007856_58790 [Azospirillum oryzae]|nr:hypothetical protein GCM10007856_58790 [Azospirillum oryzae]
MKHYNEPFCFAAWTFSARFAVAHCCAFRRRNPKWETPPHPPAYEGAAEGDGCGCADARVANPGKQAGPTGRYQLDNLDGLA